MREMLEDIFTWIWYYCFVSGPILLIFIVLVIFGYQAGRWSQAVDIERMQNHMLQQDLEDARFDLQLMDHRVTLICGTYPEACTGIE